MEVDVKKIYHLPDKKALLVSFIDRHKAGSPTDPSIFWVHLKPFEIAQLFEEEQGLKVSNMAVKGVLKELGYKYRTLSKQLATGHYAQRNEQFQIIFDLVCLMSLQSPIISIDCKKKERIGHLYRAGKCYMTDRQKTYDHDYDHLAKGKVIPHGIYDLLANMGYLTIGNSSETAEFVIDNLRWWWTEHGIHRYPDAKNLLILCDAGGANSYRHHIFKIQLQQLSKELGISFIVAHYPPYASKWNPIEHRLFCHVHQAMQGVMFDNYEIVKELCEKTKTKTDLKVVVRIHLKEYKTGMKADKNDIIESRIEYHNSIPKLNYRIHP